MDLADVPQLPGVWDLGKPGQGVHVWTFGRRAKQVNQQVGVSPGEGGQEEEAPASHWGAGWGEVPLKPSEASTHLEPQACPIILSWELDVHRIGDESRAGPSLRENGLQGKWSRLELEKQHTIRSISLPVSIISQALSLSCSFPNSFISPFLNPDHSHLLAFFLYMGALFSFVGEFFYVVGNMTTVSSRLITSLVRSMEDKTSLLLF